MSERIMEEFTVAFGDRVVVAQSPGKAEFLQFIVCEETQGKTLGAFIPLDQVPEIIDVMTKIAETGK